jgi:hypothetical protein
MKIELKKFQFFERMSEETNAFVADVYANGIKIASAKNDGHGGETFYYPELKNKNLLAEAEKYCKTLPPTIYKGAGLNGKDIVIESNLVNVIDDLVCAALKEKDAKKLEKKMEKAIMWGVKGGMSYTYVNFKVKLSEIPTAKLQMYVNEYKKKLKPNEVILNTNLEKLGIVM